MIRTIKKELDIQSKEQAYLLLKNMNYRHRLYNKGIEIIRREKEKDPKFYFNERILDKMLYNEYEACLDDYDDYCRGIRTDVCISLDKMLDSVYTPGRHYKTVFKFKQFNPNHRSFGFNAKSMSYKNGKKVSRVKELGDNYITIRFKQGDRKTFYIKESSWNNKSHPYEFDMYDIRTIHFIYKNGKFFINLVTRVKLMDTKKNKDTITNRKRRAGIDLGERNPVTLYDGKDYRVSKFPDKKINKLQKRIDNLNRHLDKKEYRSNNYNKLQLKINRLYQKQVNIRSDWRNKVAYAIVSNFDEIVVDEFSIPIAHSGAFKKDMNRVVLGRGMYLFMVRLREQAEKYNCEVIKAGTNTTRTCSICGYLNEPLPTSKKLLKCAKCGSKIQRDENAALNCYNQPNKYVIHI